MTLKNLSRASSLIAVATFLLVAFNNCGQMKAIGGSSAEQSSSSVDDTSDGTDSGSTDVDNSKLPASPSAISSQSLCLEPSGTSLTAVGCDGEKVAQNLTLKQHDDGSVEIGDGKGKCAEVSMSNILWQACFDKPEQNFTLLSAGSTTFRFVAQVNGSCLQIPKAGGSITSARCDFSAAQTLLLSASAAKPFLYSATLEKPVVAVAGPALPKVYKGMHLGGAESGNLTDKNKYGYTYAYPSNALIDYVSRKGFTLIRLSFKAGRLQPSRLGPLDPAEFGRMDKVVQYAASKGLYVVLDPHDYGTMADANKVSQKIGYPGMPASNFANFWAHVAAAYIHQPNVIFGLMNEPNGMNAAKWQSSSVAAISAIRSVGAKQLIFVPGVSWTGAHSWNSSGNGATWAQFHEPNFSFEVHQYFDSDSSGTHDTCSASVAANRLGNFTTWAEANGQRGFLGEVGWGDNAGCRVEGEAGFTHMDQHASAYLGWSYFAAGWYNGFMTLNPANLGQANETDKPQTTLILGHL